MLVTVTSLSLMLLLSRPWHMTLSHPEDGHGQRLVQDHVRPVFHEEISLSVFFKNISISIVIILKFFLIHLPSSTIHGQLCVSKVDQFCNYSSGKVLYEIELGNPATCAEEQFFLLETIARPVSRDFDILITLSYRVNFF